MPKHNLVVQSAAKDNKPLLMLLEMGEYAQT